MTTAQLSVEDMFVPGFDESSLPSDGSEPALLREKRAAAFAKYSELPMPTVRDEEWRRTDPEMFPFDEFTPAPALAPISVAPESGPWDNEFDVVVTVTDEGFHINDAANMLAEKKLVVQSLADAAVNYPEMLKRYMQGEARVKQPRKFTTLVDAFWNFGLFIYVPAKTIITRGVLIRYTHKTPGRVVIPYLVAVADELSELTIAEQYESPDLVELLALSAREFYAKQGAILRAASLQEWGGKTYHIGEDWVRAERDARVDWVSFLLGGQLSKMMVSCDVAAPNSNAYLSGLFFADKEQHIDQCSLQLHSSANTYSNLLYKGAVKDKGHSIYQGVIDAVPHAVKVDAYQMNNNLILNEGARADSLPGLEIDADDLKCSHGATCGNLDPNHLFYLRSRGLPEAEARQLLVMAFFEEVIARVPHEFMRERVRENVRHKVGVAV
ncbi:MAG: Fe-S cluster assembly protein SufD [Kiritimatiellae bacterium]|nr:Fe-S cluster assembly protein SufD [Kiritimatiellia bacterium]